MIGVMAVLFLFVGVAVVLKKSQTNVLLNVLSAVPVFAAWSQVEPGIAKRLWLVYAIIITFVWPLLGAILWEMLANVSLPTTIDIVGQWLRSVKLADKVEVFILMAFFCLPVLPVYFFSRAQAGTQHA